MDVVVVVGVGKFLWRRVPDLGKDERSEGRGLRGCRRCMFAENRGMMRDAGTRLVSGLLAS